MRKSFLSTICGGLLIASLPGLAQARFDDPPVAPPTPSVPTVTVMPVEPPVPTLEITRGTDLEALIQEADAAIETGKPWSRLIQFKPHGTVPATRVSLKMQDANFTDVLKAISEQAKFDYVLDTDAPLYKHLSVELRTVYAYAALNTITESAGMTWSSEVHDGKTIVRISKKPAMASTGLPFDDKANNNVENLLHEAQNMTYSLLNAPPKSGLPYANIIRSSETRSTFTCPNCHNQVTILRKNEEAKCATCGRALEPDWKVCPFDGTKRPQSRDDWNFCPICGKAIPAGIATLLSTPTLEMANPSYHYFAYQPGLDLGFERR